MRSVLGSALLLAGVLVAVLQVRLAARATTRPLRLGYLDQHLSVRARRLTNFSLVFSLVAGSALVGIGQPGWVRWLVGFLTLAIAVAAQAGTLRLLRTAEPTGR